MFGDTEYNLPEKKLLNIFAALKLQAYFLSRE